MNNTVRRERDRQRGGIFLKKPLITVVAPFPSLAKVVAEVIAERASEWPGSVQILIGDLEEGVMAARQAVAAGAEVIVSRGGTATMITDAVEVPVVEVQVTVLDVLRAVEQGGFASGVIGVVGYGNVIYGCEDLGRLLGLVVREIHTDTLGSGEVEAKFAAAAYEGIRLIVGDAFSVKMAAQYGMEGILIQSGKDSVYKAIKEAVQIVEVRRREQARAALLKTVIDCSAEGIMAIDEQSRIILFNPMAEEIFQLRADQVLGRPVATVIPNSRLPALLAGGESENGDIQNIGARMIATKRVPVTLSGRVTGAVASFQDVTQLQRFEQTVRRKLYPKGLTAKTSIDEIVGHSSAIVAVRAQAVRYAATNSTVLITGESGVGKEMFAQGIHNLSIRRNGPFVAVNCAAVPENLLESELFGYEEGAFTGAKKGGKAGLFEMAHQGTLFLDEIGEMPLVLQSRLLRVLQEREVMRLGGDRIIPVDVRIVAATNQNLSELAAARKFRPDLFYRLDILRLTVPPLRQRVEDINLLANYFLRKFSDQNWRRLSFTEDALCLLREYSWPGNVRQLANIVERAALLAESAVIDHQGLLEAFPDMTAEVAALGGVRLEEIERQTIEQALREEGGNYTRAAKRLGINRTTLWRKLQKV